MFFIISTNIRAGNESDIKDFYPIIASGTPVIIANMPNKVGWNGNRLYLEAHPLLEEHNLGQASNLKNVVNSVENSLIQGRVTLVDWQLIAHLSEEPDGIPHEIGITLK